MIIAMSRIVVLLSGGLDSSVCLAMNPGSAALFVDYGQPHLRRELAATYDVAAYLGADVELAKVNFPPWQELNRDDPSMLTPGRNLVLVSLASAYGDVVVIGANSDDREGYPDCRPEFFDALRTLVDVQTPLIDMTKLEIGRLAQDLGIGDLTWSCYYPVGDNPCGECDACKSRKRAFA